MTAQKIIKEFQSNSYTTDPGILKTIQFQASKAQMSIHDIHSRAIACHCECMGMNAENIIASCKGKPTPYSNEVYVKVMVKWKLIDEDGNPII